MYTGNTVPHLLTRHKNKNSAARAVTWQQAGHKWDRTHAHANRERHTARPKSAIRAAFGSGRERRAISTCSIAGDDCAHATAAARPSAHDGTRARCATHTPPVARIGDFLFIASHEGPVDLPAPRPPRLARRTAGQTKPKV